MKKVVEYIHYGSQLERPPDHEVDSVMEQAAKGGEVSEPEITAKVKGISNDNPLAADTLAMQKACGPDRRGWKVCASQKTCGIIRPQPPENFYPNRGACKKCKRAADEARKREYRAQRKVLTRTLYYCPDCNNGIAHKGTPNGKNVSAFCRTHLSKRRSEGACRQKTEFWAKKRGETNMVAYNEKDESPWSVSEYLPPNTLTIDFTDHEDLREWLTEEAQKEDRPLDRQARWILRKWFVSQEKKGEA